MSLPVDLRAALIANAPVLAAVSTRISFMLLPQEPTYPALTLELIDGDPHNTVPSTQSLHWARVRINAWGRTYGSAYETAELVETALNGQQTATLRSINALGKRNMYEPNVEAHYTTQDFSIWYLA